MSRGLGTPALGCDGRCWQCLRCGWGWNPAGSWTEQSFISKICSFTGYKWHLILLAGRNTNVFFFFLPCASHLGGEMAHLLDGFSWDGLLLLAGGSLDPILPLLSFSGKLDAKVLSSGSWTYWAWCCSHPACEDLLCTPAWQRLILVPISTFWSRGPCVWSHESRTRAGLSRRAPPAGSWLPPCPP